MTIIQSIVRDVAQCDYCDQKARYALYVRHISCFKLRMLCREHYLNFRNGGLKI